MFVPHPPVHEPVVNDPIRTRPGLASDYPGTAVCTTPGTGVATRLEVQAPAVPATVASQPLGAAQPAAQRVPQPSTHSVPAPAVPATVASQPPRAAQPTAQRVPQPSTNSMLVSRRQQGNPVLRAIRNVPWQFDDHIAADYVLSESCCALFLSLRYHLLHPDYLLRRIRELSPHFGLRLVGHPSSRQPQAYRTHDGAIVPAGVYRLVCSSGRCSFSSTRRTRRSRCLTSRELLAAMIALPSWHGARKRQHDT